MKGQQLDLREMLCSVIADQDAVEAILTDYAHVKGMEEENGPEQRETFIRHRVLPLIDAKRLAALRAENERRTAGRHVAPKLKTLEDIEQLCGRNAAKARARKENGED